jgi:hypothetical protein
MDEDVPLKIHPKKRYFELGTIANPNNDWYQVDECDEKDDYGEIEELAAFEIPRRKLESTVDCDVKKKRYCSEQENSSSYLRLSPNKKLFDESIAIDADDDFKIHSKKEMSELGSLCNPNNDWYEVNEPVEANELENNSDSDITNRSNHFEHLIAQNSHPELLYKPTDDVSTTCTDINLEDNIEFKIHPKLNAAQLGSICNSSNSWYENENESEEDYDSTEDDGSNDREAITSGHQAFEDDEGDDERQ